MELPMLIAALAAFLPVAYGAPVEAASSLSPSLLSALERDLGLSASDAPSTIKFEHDAGDIIDKLRSDLGDSFAGAWVKDGKVLKVGVTDDAAAIKAKEAGAEVSVMKTSFNKLQDAKKALDKLFKEKVETLSASDSGDKSGIALFYVDVKANKLIIDALPDSLDEAEDLAKEVGLSESEFEIRKVDALPTTYLMGGGGYLINRNTICSVGFNVHGGFISAGHCGGSGSPTAYTNGDGIGHIERSDFPGTDMNFIRTGGHVPGPGMVGAYGQQGDQHIRGSHSAPVGSGTCRSGNTTGWRCGNVEAYDVTVNYSQGPVYGTVMTSACAAGGDSGGSFVSGDQAQGVLSGGSGSCDTGGTTFHIPVNHVLGSYGLTLTLG